MRFLPVILMAALGCTEPPHRIIHIANWHVVSRDDLAADLRKVSTSPPTDAEIETQYARFLDDVEAVQVEQVEHLRKLIAEQGVRQVFVEGVHDGNVADFRATLSRLRDTDTKKWDEQLFALNGLIPEYTVGTPGYQQIVALRDELLAVMARHRYDLLQVGAVGRLMMTGELDDVLPVEDAETFQEANPVQPDGTIRFSNLESEAREKAMVERLLAGPSPPVVVLSGVHDLSDNGGSGRGGESGAGGVASSGKMKPPRW